MTGRRAALYAGMPGALLCLAVCFYTMSLPNVLYGRHEYDDGVYLAGTMRFVSGVIPYKDFVFVHPPGIMLLMAPIGLLGRLIGSDDAMALARDLTVLVTALNCVLAAFAVRHRGWVASLVAGLGLACFPMAPAADSTLFLEPYLVLFCLLGIITMFQRGRLASRRRILLAGLSLGFAGTVKVWAVLVIAAAALISFRRFKQAFLPLMAGSSIGFGLVCLPFFAMAPHAFVRDVVGDQLERVATSNGGFPWAMRVLWVTGMYGWTLLRTTQVLAVLVGVGFLLIVSAVFRWRRRDLLSADWMILASSVLSVAAMWGPNVLLAHYVYFPAAFLAMLLGVIVGMAIDHPLLGRSWARRGLAGFLIGAVGFLLPQQADYARDNLSGVKTPSFLNLFIGPGTCVVADDISVTVAGNVFYPFVRGCPNLTDAFGTWLADGPPEAPITAAPGRPQVQYNGPFAPKFVNDWASWLNEADWTVSLSKMSAYVPWTPALREWFGADFRLAFSGEGVFVYKHVRRTPPPVVG